MSDDRQQELRRVNWNEVFTVTHVFKSFRMAIHFSKMALALAAVLLLWVWGSVLDKVADVAGVTVPYGEVGKHVQSSEADFQAWKARIEQARPAVIADAWTEAIDEYTGLSAYTSLLQQEDQFLKHCLNYLIEFL